MNNLEFVKDTIEKNIKDALVQVIDLTGTADHLSVFVVSDFFKNKMLIEQHQYILDLFTDELKSNQIHALQIKTQTKEKYELTQEQK